MDSRASRANAPAVASKGEVNATSDGLFELGCLLRSRGYRFVSVTPSTHARVRSRPRTRAATLRDVFGWSLPFAPEDLPSPVLELMQVAEVCEPCEDGFRSTVRFSTLGNHLFVHSCYPTLDRQAVFFGPDSYRFAAVIDRWLGVGHGRLVDVGCGTGIGGILASGCAREVVLADINAEALRFAAVNAALAKVQATCRQSDLLSRVEGPIDAVVANPPYLRDHRGRVYRDGGGTYGEGLSVRIVEDAMNRLSPGGTLILYTGTAVVEGVDTLRAALEPTLAEHCREVDYEEVDPDVFGDELERPCYADVERLAAVALRATKA